MTETPLRGMLVLVTVQMRAACKRIEGLHYAIRTYTRTILPRCLVSFCVARYGEKQQKTLELLIYFAERFKLSTKCEC